MTYLRNFLIDVFSAILIGFVASFIVLGAMCWLVGLVAFG